MSVRLEMASLLNFSWSGRIGRFASLLAPETRRRPAARSRVETMATGTPDSQARFGQSVKGLLTEKVNTCGTDVIALTKQVLKGSRSSEVSSAPASAPGGAAHCILGEWALAPRLWQATGCWVRQLETWFYRKMPSCTQKIV
ncbi:BLOC-1-related complex subunit 7 isoform X3 [Microtus pennsylvanicus]|uniref:BLOC-1-related complex subunit 7 isoform X3 n=1 Tax=Microtus pennsylvanicus TaxID=10058 RepID=UPI003F6D3CB4